MAARQQRDAATVVISRIQSFSVEVSTANAQPPATGTVLNNGAIAINHWDQLRQSEFFPNYAPMFDQVKINSIRIKITGSQAGSAMTSNISPAVVCAFDRNGLSVGQSVSSKAISTYSSAQLKQWSTGNAFSMYQYIVPSTIMEKGMYLGTEALVEPTGTNAVSTNPCSNLSDPMLPFKPITLLAVDMGGVSATAPQTFAFTIEFEFNVTFRGMRKPVLNTSGYSLVPYSNTFTENGYYSVTPPIGEGYNSLGISVQVPQEVVEVPGYEAKLTSLNQTITENKQTIIVPPDGYDGLSSVTVTTNVPQNPNLTEEYVECTENKQYIVRAPPDYDGLSTVYINVSVQPEIPEDPNLITGWSRGDSDVPMYFTKDLVYMTSGSPKSKTYILFFYFQKATPGKINFCYNNNADAITIVGGVPYYYFIFPDQIPNGNTISFYVGNKKVLTVSDPIDRSQTLNYQLAPYTIAMP